MSLFNTLQVGRVDEILRCAGVDNFCLFLFSDHALAGGVRFLSESRMPRQIRQTYARALWHYDPFLSAATRHVTTCGNSSDQLIVERDKVISIGADPYWDFIDAAGYSDILAVIHPLCRNFYLVGGLMCQAGVGKKTTRLSAGHIVDELSDVTRESAHQLMASLLSPMFSPADNQTQDGDGFLLEAMRPSSAEIAAPLPTPREREVALLLSEGLGNKQIAACLALSGYTVENHFKRLFRKYGVRNRTALLAKLKRLQLV